MFKMGYIIRVTNMNSETALNYINEVHSKIYRNLLQFVRCFLYSRLQLLKIERFFSQMSRTHNIWTNRLLTENTYNQLKVRLEKIPEEKFDFDLEIRTFTELEVHYSNTRNVIYAVLWRKVLEDLQNQNLI